MAESSLALQNSSSMVISQNKASFNVKMGSNKPNNIGLFPNINNPSERGGSTVREQAYQSSPVVNRKKNFMRNKR